MSLVGVSRIFSSMSVSNVQVVFLGVFKPYSCLEGSGSLSFSTPPQGFSSFLAHPPLFISLLEGSIVRGEVVTATGGHINHNGFPTLGGLASG